MSHIFISYSHQDSDYAHKLEGELKRRGFEVWIDERIDYGTRWPQVIQDRLDACAALILIMTSRSYGSEWVQNELARARAKGKPVFPLLLEGDYWLAVQATQCVDVRDAKLPPPTFYDRLGRVLAAPSGLSSSSTTSAAAARRQAVADQFAGRRRPLWIWVVGSMLALVVLVGSCLGIRAVIQSWTLPTRTSAVTSTVAGTLTSMPVIGIVSTSTHTPVSAAAPIAMPASTATRPPTSTPVPVVLPTPPLEAGATRVREKDGAVMVYVPAGRLLMGSTNQEIDALMTECSDCNRAWFDLELPQHIVHVDAFWIDRTEVTNAQYRQCVEVGGCTVPKSSSSATRANYYGNPEYDDYPVVAITWYQAREFAAWVGGRLPTEAEREYACRGSDGSVYPWGDRSPGDKLLNYSRNVGDTTKVGSYPEGSSWCGVLDMSGNAWEWTQSLPKDYPYDPTDGRENLSAGDFRVVRGGSFEEPGYVARCVFRNAADPGGAWLSTGFRVVSPIFP